jgi:hypothetical protein
MSFDPLFIFGVARSGTNLVSGMLNARQDVRIALDPLMPLFKALRTAVLAATNDAALIARYPEQAAFQDYYFDPLGVRLMDAIFNGSLDQALTADAAQTLAAGVARRAALESRALPQLLAGVRGKTFAEFLSGILDAVRSQGAASQRWCGTKEVWTTEFIPLFARAMPRARFIVIRRDPRSILASLIAMMRGDQTQAAHTISYMRHWRKEAAVLDTLATDAALHRRVLTVQYESIAGFPERAARDICAFLELPFDPAMLMPTAADGSVSRGNSSFGDMAGIADSSVARWRRVLDDDTVRAIECHCGPEMRAEGYQPVNVWPVFPDAAVQGVAARAHANPGSWRSDSGDAEADLTHECVRWDMLASRSAFSEAESRRHFLFASFFEKLRAAASPQWTVAAAGVR